MKVESDQNVWAYLFMGFTLITCLPQFSVPAICADLISPTHISVFLTLGLCLIYFLPFHVKQPSFFVPRKERTREVRQG